MVHGLVSALEIWRAPQADDYILQVELTFHDIYWWEPSRAVPRAPLYDHTTALVVSSNLLKAHSTVLTIITNLLHQLQYN